MILWIPGSMDLNKIIRKWGAVTAACLIHLPWWAGSVTYPSWIGWFGIHLGSTSDQKLYPPLLASSPDQVMVTKAITTWSFHSLWLLVTGFIPSDVSQARAGSWKRSPSLSQRQGRPVYKVLASEATRRATECHRIGRRIIPFGRRYPYIQWIHLEVPSMRIIYCYGILDNSGSCPWCVRFAGRGWRNWIQDAR